MSVEESAAKCVILGGGGHAAVLIDAMLAGDLPLPYALLDPDCARWGTDLFGVPIRGDDCILRELIGEGAASFAVGVGTTGASCLRQRLFDLGLDAGLRPLSIQHPTAICSPLAELGQGVQILAGSIVNPRAQIGDNAIVNTGAIVEHDCVVESHSHIATGARLAGNVTIGEGAHVGIAACVKQGVTVARGAIVGAGAAVVEDVAANTVVVGVPAKPLRKAAA
jgi:UDP-perosamine 4-acetyltransferase